MYPDHQHPAGSYAWAERIRRLFHNEIWNIGVVDQTLADIVVRGLVEPPRWLPSMPPGRMLADPACRQHEDGSRTLYAEYLDYRRNLGEIWSAYVAPGADPTSARFSPLLARDHHMSYPFPFVDENGRTLLTAETWQAEQAFLWVHEHARDLRAAGTLMPGRAVVDPTLWHDGKRWWLFCTLRDVDADGALFLFHAGTIGAEWQPHPMNPVRTGRSGSRPAGPLFVAGGTVFRPGQDSADTYGGAVILHKIVELDTLAFHEVAVRHIKPPPGRYGAGLHTLCGAGDVTLIDGKRWSLAPASAARKVRRRLIG